MAKRQMKNDGGITLPVLNGVLHHTLEDDVYVDGRSFELLLEIQRVLAVFEPTGDDEARTVWLEIPRGEARDEDFPYEKEWFFLVTSTYRENSFLKISDRDHRYVIFTNRHFREESHPRDMVWFMEPLLKVVKERVDEMVKDPDAYNSYIKENLPYRQRSGRIKSEALNRILPERRLQVEDRIYDLIREEVSNPMTMSEIRHRIEKKYETYLSVFEEDGYTGYYYVYQSRKRKAASRKSEKYYPTFNEAMRALILEMGILEAVGPNDPEDEEEDDEW